MNTLRQILLGAYCAIALQAQAQNMNVEWQFEKESTPLIAATDTWESVSIPHMKIVVFEDIAFPTGENRIEVFAGDLTDQCVRVITQSIMAGEEVNEEKYLAWKSQQHAAYIEPDYNFVKDPSVFQASDGIFHMYYTGSAAGFQGDSPPPWRIDHATSLDGLKWTKQGTVFIADDETWEEGRVQAPSKPILYNGKYYIFYAGGPREPENICKIGYATSSDLINWEKSDDFVVSHVNNGVNKSNDPFVYQEGNLFYMFYTTYANEEEVFYRTSTDLDTWSEPVQTGAWGEGAIIWKEDGIYYLLACIGYSANGEKYHLFTSSSLEDFKYHGALTMDMPDYAANAWGHGDVIFCEGQPRFYYQRTNNKKAFQIGLATPAYHQSNTETHLKVFILQPGIPKMFDGRPGCIDGSVAACRENESVLIRKQSGK